MVCKTCDDMGHTVEVREGRRYVHECVDCWNFVQAPRYAYGSGMDAINKWIRELNVTHSE